MKESEERARRGGIRRYFQVEGVVMLVAIRTSNVKCRARIWHTEGPQEVLALFTPKFHSTVIQLSNCPLNWTGQGFIPLFILWEPGAQRRWNLLMVGEWANGAAGRVWPPQEGCVR